MDDLFNRISQLERGVGKMFQAPTVPVYDITPTPPPPPPDEIPDGQMRADIWHYTLYCDGQMVFDYPDAYILSPPDNGFVWPDDWLAGGRVPGSLGGVNVAFMAYPSTYISGPWFAGGGNWFPFIRNAYWDGTLLQTFQGGSGLSGISPFVDPFGSWFVRTYTGTGGGRAAQGSFSGSGTMWLNNGLAYRRSTKNVMYVAQWDLSTYHMQQGNAILLGTAVEPITYMWNPWGGYGTPGDVNFWIGMGIILPLVDGSGGTAEGSPHSWYFGPAGSSPFQTRTVTTGPGHSITMSNNDGTFHTMKIEATYLGHQYPKLHYEPTANFTVVW